MSMGWWWCCCFLEADFSPEGVLEGVFKKSGVFPVPPLVPLPVVAIEEREIVVEIGGGREVKGSNFEFLVEERAVFDALVGLLMGQDVGLFVSPIT